MNEKEILHILKNRKDLLEILSKKRQCLYEDLTLKEKQIKLSQKLLHPSDYEAFLVSQISSIQKQIQSLNESELKIQTLLQKFYGLDEILFDVLHRLYILNQTWYTVEQELCIAHCELIKKRKEAINRLLPN